MKNILVTGGAGFIGSNFIRYAMEQDSNIHIINLDALTYAGRKENLDGVDQSRYTFVHGSICDEDLVDRIFQEYQITRVVNFAAESHVDRSIDSPYPFMETNIMGTFNLLEKARKFWTDDSKEYRFHHVSTDEVFGSLKPEDPAFSEKTAYAPNSPYAASKASSDHIVRSYHVTFGLPITISNCSNNYGPYHHPEKLIPLMILNALRGKQLPVYGDGQQIRDWLYVEDHCRAIWLILNNGTPGETYCVGGGNQPANLEIVETICSVLDELFPGSEYAPFNKLISFVKDRPGHDRRYDINFEKIEKELGWTPSIDITTGLRMTITWYLENTDWVNAVLNDEKFNEWVKTNYQKRNSNP